jgi:hypothetical protein
VPDPATLRSSPLHAVLQSVINLDSVLSRWRNQRRIYPQLQK